MNILIINGSPRKKGQISQMLGIVREEAEKRDDTAIPSSYIILMHEVFHAVAATTEHGEDGPYNLAL